MPLDQPLSARDNAEMIFQNAIDAIGNTPIIRLQKIGAELPCELYVKCEFTNPGGSIKDRIAYWLVEDFEKRGLLKPGGTIVEGTSGNTGMGLAIAAAIKGYKCVFVLSDKMSFEKVQALRAFGAKVVVCPVNVEASDPRSYYSVARRIAAEIPGAIYVDQYNNTANRDCHEAMTGPEILRQMPDIDVFVAGIGTGGTVCGVARHLKKKRPSCMNVAVDPVGSLVYDKFKFNRDVHAVVYKVEGIGEDFLPKNYDFSVLDDMVQVDDRSSFHAARNLLLKEGLYAGGSSGTAVAGAIQWCKEQGEKVRGKKVLVILPDSGNRYLSKMWDDRWLRAEGFLNSNEPDFSGGLEYIDGAKRHG